MNSTGCAGKVCSARAFALLALVLGGCGGAPADAPATGDAQRGRRLLAQYQCGACHTIPGVASARGKYTTSLQSFGERSYISGRVPNREELLVRWITDPPSLIADTTMPRMGVSAEDARDMAAYLRGLR